VGEEDSVVVMSIPCKFIKEIGERNWKISEEVRVKEE